MEHIKKPLSVALTDLKNDLIQVVNYAITIDNVPHCCVETTLKEILTELAPIVADANATDLQAYRNALARQQEAEKTALAETTEENKESEV